MKKQAVQGILLDGLFICVGTIIYAVGINMFVQPNHLTPGGLTGLAVQMNFLFNWPTGILVLLMNIPLFVLGFVKLGDKFVFSSVFATILSSVAIDVLKLVLPVYEGDLLLVAIFGGALTGLGISLLYLRGSSMGGSNIISTIINKHFPHMPIGKISLLLNAVVIISSIFVYGNVESALCSAVGAFVSSKVVDSILVGADSGNILLTVTDKPYVLAAEIHRVAGRGATVLPAHGTAAGAEKYMLMCVAKRYEFSKIKRAIKSIDPKAFVVISDARQVLGNGFKDLS